MHKAKYNQMLNVRYVLLHINFVTNYFIPSSETKEIVDPGQLLFVCSSLDHAVFYLCGLILNE